MKLIEVSEYTGVHLLVILLHIKEYKADPDGSAA
jgi:hypothetical protein